MYICVHSIGDTGYTTIKFEEKNSDYEESYHDFTKTATVLVQFERRQRHGVKGRMGA